MFLKIHQAGKKMGPQCMKIANVRKEIIIIVTSPMRLKLLKDDDLLSLLWYN